MTITTISANKITRSFVRGKSRRFVLHENTLKLRTGRTYALTGASGSGKSTLLHILAGIDQPSSGTVYGDRCDLSTLRGREKARFLNKNIGFVFQFHHLLFELSVLENVMLPGLIAGEERAACRHRAFELLDQLDIQLHARVSPVHLSGGERQRVAIARALFNRPPFIFADEPTGSLDAASAARVTALLTHFSRTWGCGVVVCSHDRAVFEHMDTVLRLSDGLLKVAKDKKAF